MSAPIADETFGLLHVGDTKDDDAQVVDSFLIETDAPPPLVIEAIDTAPLVKPKPATVLRTGSVLLALPAAAWAPYKVMVADINRQELRLEGFSSLAAPTFEDYALVAYDPGLLTAQSGYRLRHGEKLTLDSHTGDLYVLINPLATGTFEVSWVGVTY
jgi:hypothetical protein